MGNIIAIVASILVGGGIAAATVVGVVTSSTDNTVKNPPTVSESTIQYGTSD
ncbi:hypothetical protein [Nocardioides panzhihuensis]|uniref:DUF2613 family protein n=1 Tax=Nocardioides panzhihuensis TaxID=860243 RepID=A0A7Z0DJY2_9ACTN|nr:hypothetical protein [Nocardioides panzhihuensis]NYI76591.1 hypothetical protein [Nocardioides panzhihuensis]